MFIHDKFFEDCGYVLVFLIVVCVIIYGYVGFTMMDASDLKRVRIETTGGRTCYCAGAWPGWQNLRLAFFLIGILAFVEAVMLFMQYQFSNTFGGDDWFRKQYFYRIFVSYQLNLLPWLEYILPKKADRWFVMLLDAIPSKKEADFVLEKILDEVITVK